jgi:hypothetical protein
VPPGETAAANSLNTLMRMLGTSSCSSFVAAIATGLTTSVAGQTLPAAAAYTVIYLAAAGAAAIGATIAAFTPRAETAGPVPTATEPRAARAA